MIPATSDNLFASAGCRVGLLAAVVALGCGNSAAPSAPEVLPPLPAVVEAAPTPRGVERPARELTLALVGELRGEIEPCGCPTLPLGGFERRENLLDRLRAEGPVLQFDAGETLLKGVATTRGDNRKQRSHLMIEASARVGVDAWAVGPTDLQALGVAGLGSLSGGPPALSATWLGADGRPLLRPWRVIERGGVIVGVIGLSADPGESVRARDPVEAAREAVGAMGPVDLVVALGNVGDEAAARVATEVDGVGIVMTTKGEATDPPHFPARADGSSGALVVETSDRGRYLHVVHLRLGSDPDQGLVLEPPERRWRALWTLREQARNLAGTDRAEAVSAQLSAAEAQFAEVGRGRNLALVSAVPLAADLDGDTSVSPLLARFKKDTEKQAAERAMAPPERRSGYAASGACVNCHAEEFARWSYTRHARAWEALIARDADDDPECVVCHSTGYGEPGGFGAINTANTRKFKAVQCEACHGPLLGHPEDHRVKTQPIAEVHCRTCHDEANSPGFDYTSYLRRATCQEVATAP